MTTTTANHETREALRELMAHWDKARAAWLKFYGNDEGFSDWFTAQVDKAKAKTEPKDDGPPPLRSLLHVSPRAARR